ncbi:MAG: RIP metalloprotease RseP [Muribaculum sp.]|nr:RIP metalloprotease RseP [Muribaculaceae bacterium]MCM1080957.1 RIP metalloprotease RseP [Muribaculum sp.]
MEAFLIKAAQLIAALSLLVVIHEAGHFFVARLFGIKVEKFYIFFDPWFSLFKFKPKKKNNSNDEKSTWRDTEYGIGWVPFGGYVKIAGMIDESMDKEQMAQPAKPWEFRSKPAWQRLLVMIAGVIMNFVLAIIIYAGIAFYWGEKYIPFEDAYEGLEYCESAKKAGFVNGDIPLLADNKKIDVTDADHIMKMIEAKNITVLRNHKDTVTINMPENFIFQLNEEKSPMFGYRLPVVVKSLLPGEPAKEAGLLEGDHIIKVDTISTPSYTEFTAALTANAGKTVPLEFIRNGKKVKTQITPTESGKIGIGLSNITEVYPVVTKRYGMFGSIPRGWDIGVDRLTSYVKSFKYVATAEGAKSLGGFGAIGSMFPDKWDWLSFWEITAFLSVALAFMNFLPIPALDGGHIMFTLYEMISGRKPNEKVLEYAQIAGMVFLFTLLIYANGNDIYRFFLK